MQSYEGCTLTARNVLSQVFAAEGLRTLVTAYKDIPLDAYKEWEAKYKEARWE